MTNTLIMSSRTLGEKENLEGFSKDIELFLKHSLCSDAQITIGQLKNGNMIEHIRTFGYDIQIHKQHPVSLYNSNRKLIREHDMVLFLVLNHSSNMMDFMEYAQEQHPHGVKVLYLST